MLAVGLFLGEQAQAATTPMFVISDFISAISGWGGTILASALALFWLLAAIDFIWMGMTLALKQADIAEVVAEIVHRVMHIGFFLALLTFSSSWAPTIIQSLTQLATNASGAPAPTISAVMGSAMTICGAIFSSMSLWSIGTSILLALLCVVILLLFALIAAEIAVSLVSVWLIIYAGMIMLGFGGSRWTQDYAISYYRAVLGASVKLYVMQMLLGVGMTVIGGIAATATAVGGANIVDFFAVAAACLILYVLIMRIGELTHALMSGHVMASSNALATAVAATTAAAATVGGAAAATVGGAAAISSASKLATAERDASGGSSLGNSMASVGKALGGSGGSAAGQALGTALSHAAHTVGNLVSGSARDYMGSVKGEPGSTMGTKGGRMSSRMDDQAATLSAEGSKPNVDDIKKQNYIFGVEHEAAQHKTSHEDDKTK